MTALLDFAPLEAKLADSTMEHNDGPTRMLCEMLGVTGESLWRYRHQGISFDTADRLATRSGYHPTQIWGDDYFDGSESCPGCDESDRLCEDHEGVRLGRLRRHFRTYDAKRLALWWIRLDRYRGTVDPEGP